MGQKVNPVGLRVGINRTWDSRWFAARGEYGKLLHEDRAIRAHIMKEQREAGISKVVIERPHKKCRVTVMTARPGILIGKKGEKIERLRADLAKLTSSEVHLNILEIRKPEIDATLIAEGIAQQLERRVAFRRAMKRAVQSALRLGAVGIRINVAGRLGGAEIARTEWYREGRVPLHTLRADIDFGYGVARTAYGIIGIKVWVFKGEIIEHDPMASDKKLTEMQESGAPRPRRDDDRGDRRDRRPGRGGRGGGGGGAAWPRSRCRCWRRCCSGSVGRRPIDAGSVRIREARDYAATETDEVPQTVQGSHSRRRQKSGTTLAYGEVGLKAMEPERLIGAPDRSRAPRHRASYEACRPHVASHLPGRAGVEEAGRSPHGLWQGFARALGCARQARPHHLRAWRLQPAGCERSFDPRRRQAADQMPRRDADRIGEVRNRHGRRFKGHVARSARRSAGEAQEGAVQPALPAGFRPA